MFRRNWEIWLLSFVMLSGLCFRIYHLPQYPYHDDGAGTIPILKSIVETGLPLTETGHLYWRSLLANYLMAIPIFFAEVSPYSTRLVCVIFSILLLPVGYLMGREIQGRSAGWLAVFFLLFSAYENAYASFARGYILFQFFFTVAVFFAGHYFILRRPRSGIWLLLATLGAIGCHKFSVELIPVFAIAFFLGRRWEILRSSSFYLGCFLGGVMAYFNFVYIPENTFVNYIAIPLRIGALADKWAFYGIFREFVPFGGTLLVLGLVPLWKTRNKPWIFYALSFVVSMIFLSAVAPHGAPRYMSNLFPLGVVLCIASLTWWVKEGTDWIRQGFSSRLSPGVGMSAFVVVLAALHLVLLENRQVEKGFGTYFRFPDQKPAHDFIARNMEPSDLIISIGPIFTKIYLDRPADFFIREKLDESQRRFRPFTAIEKSTWAVPIIDSPDKLEFLIKERRERIWLYGNYKLNFTVSPRTHMLLRRHFRPVFRHDDSFVWVKL